MDKHYVLVTGRGTTSRANVEALLEDYIYAAKDELVFVLEYEKSPSQGQVFIAQLARDKGKDIIVFAHPDAKFDGLTTGFTFNPVIDTFTEAVAFVKGEKATAIFIWDDEDESQPPRVRLLKDAGIKSQDITQGLMLIKVADGSLSAPEPVEIPEAEQVEEEVLEDEDLEEAEEVEDDDEEPDLEDDIYYGIQAFIKALAKAVVAELQNAPETPSKGDEA